jgi:cyclic pyranopterin phosphate synthase
LQWGFGRCIDRLIFLWLNRRDKIRNREQKIIYEVMNMNLTHLDAKNRPQMVDVSDKEVSARSAAASGKITMSGEAFNAIINERVKKGPVLQTAVIAAIMGAKKTSDLIPMCHPLALAHISCDIEEDCAANAFRLIVSVKLNAKTGAEMEALTGVSIGLLTIYDMVKAIDKSMIISDIRLENKSGGKSGDFQRAERRDQNAESANG